MVVEDVAASVRAVLAGPRCHARGLRPAGLNPLTVCTSGPLRIAKVEYDLTLGTMPREVKLRDNDLPVLEIGQLRGGNPIGAKTSLEVLFPLTTDIV